MRIISTPSIASLALLAAFALSAVASAPVRAQTVPFGALEGLESRPERVLLVGSSSIHHGFGDALVEQLEERGGVGLTNAGRSATGLSRLDYFDWLTHAAERVAEVEPQLVIAQFGGNDCQAIIDPDESVVARWGEDGWDEAYSERLRSLVRVVEQGGARIVFVGMPRMQSPSFSRRIAHVNELVRAVANETGALYYSTWEMTSEGNAPRAHVTVDGTRYPMREEDGIHLSVRGAHVVAAAILAELEAIYDLRPLD